MAPINRTSEEFLTLHTECTLGQRAKGQRGINPRPGRQAGRPYLNKPGMPDRKEGRGGRMERGKEEEEEGAEGEGTSCAINMNRGASANKYQHFLNDLRRV